MIAFVTIGNSSAKLYRYDRGRVDFRQYPSNMTPDSWLKDGLPEKLYVASVNPEVTEQVLTQLECPCQVISNDLVRDVRNRTVCPERTGIDRLLNAYAAHHERPHCNSIVADCGTALSISVTTSRGEFLGGAICLGIQAEAKALSTFTAQLPEVYISGFPASPIGASTEAALQAGIIWQKTGMLKIYAEQASMHLRSLNQDPTVLVLTGGWASLIVAHLGESVLHDRHLTFKGLFQVVNACFYDNSLSLGSIAE